ncbi:MAG: cupin domain-containing protein [Gammaproteobacteria bacterium]|nr:cupin domain-containing protein [Gammaproteobacteria bacterium]
MIIDSRCDLTPTLKPSVIKYKPQIEYLTEENCYINELSNNDTDESASIARARVEPGITTRWHRLSGVTERYVILSGEGIVEVDDMSPTHVKSNDVVIIPQNYRQRIRNTGNQDLVFLAVCTPRFTESCYEDVESVME